MPDTAVQNQNTTKYTLTEAGERLAQTRYYKKDDNGNVIENWEQLARRVVNHVCKDEDDDFKEKAFQYIAETKFLPNTPCLVNAGRETKNKGLSACYVTKAPDDSWEEIMLTVKRFGDVARAAGGCGVSFSKIRPEGAPVFGSSHAKACGPIEVMRIISETMSSITQSGVRGMACMSVLHVWHPDILKFIKCKQRERALKTFLKEDIFHHFDEFNNNTTNQLNIVLDKFISNFNISVMVSNKFMEAVKHGEDWDLEFNGKIYDTIQAQTIFTAIAENAWKNGDPGLLFEDAINNGPYKYSGQNIDAPNPCGEQILPHFGVCNLLSIDVSKFYDEQTNCVDWKELKSCIHTSIRFLDNVVDANVYPGKEFKDWANNNRPIGLGVMGWADLLLKKKLPYGSKQSVEFAEELAKFFETESHKTSCKLAKEKGTPQACKYKELNYRRNITLTSIAPTGSISLLAGCSSSIEPIFSETIYRYDNTGQYITKKHPDADKPYFRCALDKEQNGAREVSYEQHIAMQAAFQKYGSSGISKTCNLPGSATIDDVKKAYMLAWKSGCKGITVYRDGCKTTQVLNTMAKTMSNINPAADRPETVNCDIFKTKADGFDWHIIIGKVDDAPYELFAVNGRVDLPKSGKIIKKKKRHYVLQDDENNILIENLATEEEHISPQISVETRRFSLELRHGIPPKYIVEQIDKSTAAITSFTKAVGRIMKTKVLTAEDCASIAEDIACPSCAKEGKAVNMVCESGCWKCLSCHYSRCS